MPNHAQEKIAKILRISKELVVNLESELNKVTGKSGVLEKIAEENNQIINEKLGALGVGRASSAVEVYDALISRIEADDLELLKIIGHSELRGYEASKRVCQYVCKLHPPGTGFFIKKEKAKKLLLAEPPKKIMAALGYDKVEELIEKEELFEVFSALRFLEDADWQNNVFFKQYEKLTPDDFEERQIELKPLSEKWSDIAERFVQKKYHNVSHLKELGIIFVTPIFLGISGETLRLVSLLLHYLHEIGYYSDLIKNYFARDRKDFSKNLVSVLRGDVVKRRLPEFIQEAKRPRFLVVQRYLAKDDENDWRLFEPRINPEALHWHKAEQELINLNDLSFWSNAGWVGDFFKSDVGTDVLVSFNLVDTVMALVKQKELIKYLYHHQEALWNKIFIEYFSEGKLETLSKKNIIKGWFEI